MRIRLKDGSYEFVDSNEQFARLVEQSMGEDAKSYVNGLIDDADYQSKRLNTDLDSYEETCGEYESAAEDMSEYIMQAIRYICDSSRIDKSKVIKLLNDAQMIYRNNF